MPLHRVEVGARAHRFPGRAALTAGIVAVAAACCIAADGPEAPSPGASRGSADVASFLDPPLRAAWQEAELKPAPPAKDEEFLRRAYLDILGRIPTVAEAREFLAAKGADKRARLVDHLLEHVDYPKNFATVWTNLLLGRGRQERNVDRDALASWLRKQIAANRPWDDVVYDLVTATGSNKENGAVNYTIAHLEGDAVPLTSRSTRLFLGRQLQCVQCHDHPQNDWKQADFWGVNAFYRGLKVEEKRVADAAGLERVDHVELSDVPTGAFARFDRRNGMMGVAFPRFIDGRKVDNPEQALRRVELGKLIVDPESDMLAQATVNRAWAHFMGRGFVNPVDDIGPHNPPVLEEAFEALTEEFRASGHDVKQLIRWITSSAAYQASSVRPAKKEHPEDELFSVMALRPMSPEQLFDSLLTATAAHRPGTGRDDARRESWMRQFLFTFGNDEDDETTSFQGTIPQSLMMMNGDLMRDALSGKPGSFLADALEQARRSRRPAAFMVDQLYMAALSRRPTSAESSSAVRYLESYPDAMPFLQDLFWALLNSNEFILNH
ncbi:DUF1549 domain-containing protein [Paludisphaera sp.]|uniref:DUF1549 domain-containing protein n=1 Tax=Paludisphaera sp. TaxID=2017432 RepID=UPI00301C31DD